MRHSHDDDSPPRRLHCRGVRALPTLTETVARASDPRSPGSGGGRDLQHAGGSRSAARSLRAMRRSANSAGCISFLAPFPNMPKKSRPPGLEATKTGITSRRANQSRTTSLNGWRGRRERTPGPGCLGGTSNDQHGHAHAPELQCFDIGGVWLRAKAAAAYVERQAAGQASRQPQVSTGACDPRSRLARGLAPSDTQPSTQVSDRSPRNELVPE